MKSAILLTLVATALASMTDKVVLITGSTRGIGAEAAKYLASKGASVIVSGRNAKDGATVVTEITAAGGTALFARIDVADAKSVEDGFALAEMTFGGVDYVFANAGYAGKARLGTDYDLADTEKIVGCNVNGMINTVKYGTRALKKRGGGAMVFCSSIAGAQPLGAAELMPVSSMGLYGGSKAFMDMMLRSTAGLAKEDVPIEIYGLAPACYDTVMLRSILGTTMASAFGVAGIGDLAGFNPVFSGVPGDPAMIAPMVEALLEGAVEGIKPGEMVLADNKFMFPWRPTNTYTSGTGPAWADIDLGSALDQSGKPTSLTKEMVELVQADYAALANKDEL